MSVEVKFPEVLHDKPEIEGVLSTWFVSDGDRVDEGQLLAEVQVEKAAVEISAPTTGVIRIVVSEETVVAQGSTIAFID